MSPFVDGLKTMLGVDYVTIIGNTCKSCFEDLEDLEALEDLEDLEDAWAT